MKKFLRSKIGFTENSNQSPPHGADHSPSASPEPHTTKEEQEALLEKAKSVAPLTPAAPTALEIDPNLPRKQEIDVNEYENNNPTSPVDQTQQNKLALASDYDGETNQNTKKTICRDFVRGTCIRGAVCKYAHQCDLSQLYGVYTFCRNFQNTVCVLPQCRYVHATVFEEQNFYRTGMLPPHAFSHHKKPIVLPPPPPPPPEEPPPEEHVFAKPVLIPRRVKSTPKRPKPPETPHKQVIKCVPTANLEARPADNDFRISNQPRDIDLNSTKNCKNCDTMEFRLQFNKDKTENMKRTTDDLKNKVGILTKKTHTLYSVLWALMKPQAAKLRPEGLNGLSALLSIINDSEKGTGDQNLTLGIRES